MTKSPELLARAGTYAPVPFIIGDQEDDEETLFSLSQSNISTTQQIVNYLDAYLFHDATEEQLQQLIATYPDGPAAGSPFRAVLMNNIYPQFKRLAAMLGDLVFTLKRGVFLNITTAAKPSVPSWSYLASYSYSTPILGTFHA